MTKDTTADHAAADALMAGSRTIVGEWEYFAVDHTDEDTGKDLSHFLVNVNTGQQKDIRFSRYDYMQPADIMRLLEMGWPRQNVVLGYPGANWTSRDIELAWFRWIASNKGMLEISTPNQGPVHHYWWLAAFLVFSLAISQIAFS